MLISHDRCVVGNAAILMLIRSCLRNSELREVVKVKAAAPPDASGGGIGDVSICCVLINTGRCRSLSIGILGLRTNARLFWRTSNDRPSAKISCLLLFALIFGHYTALFNRALLRLEEEVRWRACIKLFSQSSSPVIIAVTMLVQSLQPFQWL